VAVCEALSGRDEAEVIEILGAAVLDARWQVRSAAAGALAATGRSGAVPPLIEALRKAEGRTVDDVEAALVKLTRKRFPPVAKAWDDWWAKDGKEFKGPRDPGYGEAAGAGDAGGDGAARSNGDRISFYGIETNSKRVLFVLDFSGSMNFAGSESDAKRHKIDVLKEEMRKTLAGMPDGAKFGMVGFSSDVRVWRKGLPPALRDQKTARDAMDWVEKQPVVGSTNIYDALETAFRSMGVGLSADKSYEPLYDTIFFMTDGVPTSGKVTDKAVLLGEVKRWNAAKRVRIHVIGMGGKSKSPHPGGQDDVDKDFLQKLADQSGGECVFR
jgi:Mg-chelatase subunit ChlD